MDSNSRFYMRIRNEDGWIWNEEQRSGMRMVEWKYKNERGIVVFYFRTNPFAGMMMMSNVAQPPPPPPQYAPPTNPTPHFTGHSGVIIQGSGSASILGQPQVATYSQQYQQQYPQGQQPVIM